MRRAGPRAAVLAGVLAAATALAAVTPARAQSDEDGSFLVDYDPLSKEWNGLSRWTALCAGNGLPVSSVASLDWNLLGAEDVLVLMYPLARIEPHKLEAFVSAGGHVVIADDFGNARDALAQLGILRAEVGEPKTRTFYENLPYAPIAVPKAAHPINDGIVEVITNHPAALHHVRGATEVIGFDEGAVVVAGERGTGRFVAVSDPSIFINSMLEFRGNLQLATNILRWLLRGGRAERIVLVRGDVPMYGDPRPFIDDARAGSVGRKIADLNRWLDERSAWLLTPGAMRVVAGGLALLLLGLTFFALPLRRGPAIDGGWLRSVRPARRDDPGALIKATDHGSDLLVAACLVRDHVQRTLADGLGQPEPLYGLPQGELLPAVRRRFGEVAERQLAALYRRLKSLPSRGQAAAPWSATDELSRADFDALFTECRELCRSLGRELPV
ncbi:MAG: DUF4350 domain-containing protein [Kofleriaceae bacterium]